MSHKRAKITTDYRLTPRDCKSCGRFMDKEFLREKLEEMTKLKSAKIITAMEDRVSRGETIGRKRVADYSAIYILRDKGMSINKIADQMEISRGSVQHALSIRKASP